jgi:hypothetical protein
VQVGAAHVLDKIKPGDTEVAELITTLVRFRTQAVASATATLGYSIETTIESLVSQLRSEFIEKTPEG